MRTGRRLLVAIVAGALVCAVSAVGTAGGSSAACPAGTKRAVIGGKVKCLKVGQRCSGRYQATYKRYGFTCVNGRLRKRTTTPPPPAPPQPEPPPTPAPPPPPAQPGHYHGTDSQLETIDLDVSADGRTLRFSTGQINQGCTPPGHIYGGGLTNAGPFAISTDGSFVIDGDYHGSFSDGTAYTGHFNMTGRFNAATASGTLSDSLSFTANGTGYRCGSGVQSWTATRTG
jgi:hypothetical protein